MESKQKIAWPKASPTVTPKLIKEKATAIKRAVGASAVDKSGGSSRQVPPTSTVRVTPSSPARVLNSATLESDHKRIMADIRRRVGPTVKELSDDHLAHMIRVSNALLRELSQASDIYAPAGVSDKARKRRAKRLVAAYGQQTPGEGSVLLDATAHGDPNTSPLQDAEPGLLDKMISGAGSMASGVWNGMSDTSKAVVTAAGGVALTPLAMRLARLRGQRVDIDVSGGGQNASAPMMGASMAGSDGRIMNQGYTVLRNNSKIDQGPVAYVDGGLAMNSSASIPVDVPYRLLQMGRAYGERIADAKWKTFATTVPPMAATGDVYQDVDYHMAPVAINQQGEVVSGYLVGALSALAREQDGLEPHLTVSEPFMDADGGFLQQGNWFKKAAKGAMKMAGPALKVGLKVAKALPVVGNVLMVADIAASMAGTDLGTLAGKAFDSVTGGSEDGKAKSSSPAAGEEVDPKRAAAIAKGQSVMSLEAKMTAAAAAEAAEKKGAMTNAQLEGLALDVEVGRTLQAMGYTDAQILELTAALDDQATGEPLDQGDVADGDDMWGQGGYATRSMGRIARSFRSTGSRYAKTTTQASKIKRAKFGSATSTAPPTRPGLPSSTVRMTSDARRAMFESLVKSKVGLVTIGTVGLGTIFLGAYHINRWEEKARDKQLIIDRIGVDSADRMFELAAIAKEDGASGLTSAERLEFLGYMSDLETTGVAEFASARAGMRAAAIDAQRKAGEVSSYTPTQEDVHSPVLSSNLGLMDLSGDGSVSKVDVERIAGSGTKSAESDKPEEVAAVTNPILMPFLGIIPAPILAGIQKIAPVILAIGGTALLMTLIDRAVRKAKKVDNDKSLSIPVSLI